MSWWQLPLEAALQPLELRGCHVLVERDSGAELQDIRECERTLGVALSPQFRTFLTASNGFGLSATGNDASPLFELTVFGTEELKDFDAFNRSAYANVLPSGGSRTNATEASIWAGLLMFASAGVAKCERSALHSASVCFS